MNRKYLFPFLIFAFINLVFGMYAGLGRIGWSFPFHESYLHHGAVMVGGFLGTLISLEKVIPLKKNIFLVVPLMSALSLILFFTGHFTPALIMLICSSAGLVMVYLTYLRRQYDLSMLLMVLSAVFLLIGHVVLFTQRFYPMALPWWMAFLLFTIVAERLELSRFLPVSVFKKRLLLFCLALFITGIIIPFHGPGKYFSGVALVSIAMWLMRNDVIRINLKKQNLTKFSGYALLCGYIALLLVGVFLLVLPDIAFAYDAIVHTFFLGFSFAMIFAHGPIILPGVMGSSVKPYHKFLYVPLILLMGSLLIRIASDLYFIPLFWRLISGYISATAILLYFTTLITLMVRSFRNAKIL